MKKSIHLRLVTLNGMAIPAARGGRTVHSQEIIGCEPLALKANSLNNSHPCGLWDAFPVAPLLDRPATLTNSVGHLRDGLPNLEHIIDRLHGNVIQRDELSRQDGITMRMTRKRSTRTICPMGKAVSPTKFKIDFCARLAAARLTAGYATAEDFAETLGIKADTYRRYEKRTLMPMWLLPTVCELLDCDPSFLLTGAREKRRQAA